MAARLATPGEEPTPRETQVAIALLFGHSVPETAIELGMRPATVSCHRERLYVKYGAVGAGGLAAKLTGLDKRLPAWLMPQDEE